MWLQKSLITLKREKALTVQVAGEKKQTAMVLGENHPFCFILLENFHTP